MQSTTFQQLLVWQKAHAFVLQVYQLTTEFPKSEIYGLTSQFRRAAISIAANIAEGYKKKDYKSKINYLNIAQSSLEECRYYIILSKDLNYLNNSDAKEALEDVSRLLNAYYKAIIKNHAESPPLS